MGKEPAANESKKIQQAYTSISEFFDAWSLQQANRYLFKILQSTMDTNPTNINPSTVLYFFKTLDSLITAVLRIQAADAYRNNAIVELDKNKLPDLTNHAYYFGRHRSSHPWQFIPRALSPKEYANPYRVFKKLAGFGNKPKWKFILNELQDYAFFNTSFAECADEINILSIYRLLHKLIEVAHLVDVRSNNRNN